MPKLLFLVSSASELILADGSTHETGYFAEEALTPFELFEESGIEVVVTTVDGRLPHADPYGLEPFFHYPDEDKDFLNKIVRSFAHDVDDIRMTLQHLTEQGLIAARRVNDRLKSAGMTTGRARAMVSAAAKQAWRERRSFVEVMGQADLPAGLTPADLEQDLAAVVAASVAESKRVDETLHSLPGFQNPRNLAKMSDEEIAGFDGLFVPGGHGPMVDMADNADVTRVLAILHEKRAPIASLCHGPAMLLAAPAGHDGTWLFDGYRMTAFTDEEESQTPPGLLGMEWLLEAALRNSGAVFDDGRQAWASHVVVDRNLITAQNPDSADAAAEAVIKALSQKFAVAA